MATRAMLQAVRYWEARLRALGQERAWVALDIADHLIQCWMAGWHRGRRPPVPGPPVRVEVGFSTPREFAEAVIEAISDELPEVSVERMEVYAAELADAYSAGLASGAAN